MSTKRDPLTNQKLYICVYIYGGAGVVCWWGAFYA